MTIHLLISLFRIDMCGTLRMLEALRHDLFYAQCYTHMVLLVGLLTGGLFQFMGAVFLQIERTSGHCMLSCRSAKH